MSVLKHYNSRHGYLITQMWEVKQDFSKSWLNARRGMRICTAPALLGWSTGGKTPYLEESAGGQSGILVTSFRSQDMASPRQSVPSTEGHRTVGMSPEERLQGDLRAGPPLL